MLTRTSAKDIQKLRRSSPSRRPQARRKPKESAQVFATETIAKLCVNGLLGIVAIVALVRLSSYNIAQRDKLQLLETEVQASQSQLDAEREDFSYHFDPTQGRSIMQDQSYRVQPGQAQIVFSPSDDSVENNASEHTIIRESRSVSDEASEASSTANSSVESSAAQPVPRLEGVSESTNNPESTNISSPYSLR